MKTSASKHANTTARKIAASIDPKDSIRWQQENGEAFTHVSARTFARDAGIDISVSVNWMLAAELLNQHFQRSAATRGAFSPYADTYRPEYRNPTAAQLRHTSSVTDRFLVSRYED